VAAQPVPPPIFGNWHDAIENQITGDALKSPWACAWVALAVLLAIGVSPLRKFWPARRGCLRLRTRLAAPIYQFLLLRRIALWCLVVVIVGLLRFASELGFTS